MKRYAENTTVPMSKSRGEIDDLLRQWGCDAIRWTDDFKVGLVSVEFVWTRNAEERYSARISITLPDEAKIRKRARHASTGAFLPSRFETLMKARGQQEMRVLLLWLKASFNSIEAGIVTAEAVFLPYLIGTDGRTVAEVALPRMRLMLTQSANAMLGLPATCEAN